MGFERFERFEKGFERVRWGLKGLRRGLKGLMGFERFDGV